MHRRSFLTLGLSFAWIGKSFATSTWQSYADRIIANNAGVYGVIASCEYSYSIWAEAGRLLGGATPSEIEVLVKRFQTPTNGQQLIIASNKYTPTKCNYDILSGRVGSQGIAVAKSKRVIVIGCSVEGQNMGKCSDNVVKIVNELKAVNY